MTLAFDPTTVIASDLAGTPSSDLGNVEWSDGVAYRLVKAAAEITSPAGKILVTAATAGVPTWNVNTTTTASNVLVAGVVPAGITATIASGSYFYIQVSGAADMLASVTTTGGAIGTSTVAGSGLPTGASAAGQCGVNLAAATAANGTSKVLLRGLI